jgi:hypothetical protein
MQPMPRLIMKRIITTIMTKQSSGTHPKACDGNSRHHGHAKGCGVAGSAANTDAALAS